MIHIYHFVNNLYLNPSADCLVYVLQRSFPLTAFSKEFPEGFLGTDLNIEFNLFPFLVSNTIAHAKFDVEINQERRRNRQNRIRFDV